MHRVKQQACGKRLAMPRRQDLHSVLIIGSGPIVIGQACEFDYSGTQACKALREEGIRVVLVNSNPATIMTDPEIADATYVEPLTVEVLDKILAAEKVDAILPTLGGQTGLNLAMAASKAGILEKHRVELLGATVATIEMAEDRELFKQAMARIGLDCPRSRMVHSVEEARGVIDEIGFPAILRPSFTMGGSGGGIAYNRSEFDRMVQFGLDQSPVHSILVEESVLGWKEFELEVVRDRKDNTIIVCSIENLDPMGVHTGDSITVAPAMTLTDKEYQRMRDASIAIMREIGVTTGGSNVQYAVDPKTGRMLVIEMNPRVSRSSALASKATGFPIAKIAAKLAIGYTLDELQNDITKVTPASFEPTIDYVVVKWPRFAFEKFPKASPVLGPQMKSVGEAMSIGRTFREALGKAIRSLETGRAGFDLPMLAIGDDLAAIERAISTASPDRLFQVGRGFQLGLTLERAHELTRIDPWFLHHIRDIALAELQIAKDGLGDLRRYKRLGLSDRRIAALTKQSEAEVRAARHAQGVRPVYKRVDTCAAEYESNTPYLYSTYEEECESRPTDKRKVMILGGGPNRIGQGIEFDYCCVHAAMALREEGIESIMVNCNPETVSTDYDTSDRLYFEPLTLEDVLEICDLEKPWGVIVQFGGQTPLKLAVALAAAGVPILGTSADAIDRAEDRERFGAVMDKLDPPRAALGHRAQPRGSARRGEEDRLPDHDPPELRARRSRDGARVRRGRPRELLRARDRRRRSRREQLGRLSAPRRPVPRRCGRARRRRDRGSHRRGRGRRRDGAHRGGRHPLRRLGVRAAALLAAGRHRRRGQAPGARARDRARRDRPHEHAVRDRRRRRLRHRGQPARLAHGAVREQGDRRAAREDRREGDGRQVARRARDGRGRAAPRVGQGGRVPVREVRGRRHAARPRDALHRRGDGHRFGLRARVREEPARRRHAPADRAAPRSCRSAKRTSRPSWRSRAGSSTLASRSSPRTAPRPSCASAASRPRSSTR